ncbi:MAG: NADH-quinone oxidoreductase subunit J [Nitriliruptoraceae bacterium]
MTVLTQGGIGLTATPETVLFIVFGVLALGSALAVIMLRNVVHAALMLVVNLLAIAGLFLGLQSAFLSIIQVLVYGGAIMVLFLFVIMLLGVNRDDLLVTDRSTRILAFAGAAVLSAAILFTFIGPYTSAASICGPEAAAPTAVTDVRCYGLEQAYDRTDGAGAAFLGGTLFTRYTYAFELSAVLLTVATIGAVLLARRRDRDASDDDIDDIAETLPSDDTQEV